MTKPMSPEANHALPGHSSRSADCLAETMRPNHGPLLAAAARLGTA